MEHPTFYRTEQIDGLSIFYREAGPKSARVIYIEQKNLLVTHRDIRSWSNAKAKSHLHARLHRRSGS